MQLTLPLTPVLLCPPVIPAGVSSVVNVTYKAAVKPTTRPAALGAWLVGTLGAHFAGRCRIWWCHSTQELFLKFRHRVASYTPGVFDVHLLGLQARSPASSAAGVTLDAHLSNGIHVQLIFEAALLSVAPSPAVAIELLHMFNTMEALVSQGLQQQRQAALQTSVQTSSGNDSSSSNKVEAQQMPLHELIAQPADSIPATCSCNMIAPVAARITWHVHFLPLLLDLHMLLQCTCCNSSSLLAAAASADYGASNSEGFAAGYPITTLHEDLLQLSAILSALTSGEPINLAGLCKGMPAGMSGQMLAGLLEFLAMHRCPATMWYLIVEAFKNGLLSGEGLSGAVQRQQLQQHPAAAAARLKANSLLAVLPAATQKPTSQPVATEPAVAATSVGSPDSIAACMPANSVGSFADSGSPDQQNETATSGCNPLLSELEAKPCAPDAAKQCMAATATSSHHSVMSTAVAMLLLLGLTGAASLLPGMAA